MAKTSLPIFETAFGRYKALGIIGEGGAGRVYKAADESNDQFAVKMLTSDYAGSDRLKRFKNEIHFCIRNRHKNVVNVVDHGVCDNGSARVPFYVMPLFDASLRTLMEEGITPELVLQYFNQLLDGVEAAHLLGVVHRDLKPENILVNRKEDRLVLADFGIARFQEEELWTAIETRPGDRLANFVYAAPEQRIRGGTVDHRADIYALGLILNEMFTGEIPQGTGYKTIANVSPSSAYLDDLVAQMISQSPSERPSSIADLKKVLIGREQDFVVAQRLSQLKDTVVPVTDIDDPLVLDPPRLVAVDWEHDQLTLTLSRAVNNKWVSVLVNNAGVSFMLGYHPRDFRFSGDTAVIGADHGIAAQVVRYFNEWLPLANAAYATFVQREKDEQERQSRRKLEAAIEQQERRKQVLKSIQI